MAVRAKFVCESKLETAAGFRIQMKPVTGGSQENDSFYKYTPGGEIALATLNPAAANQFEVGRSYYIDFTPAAE